LAVRDALGYLEGLAEPLYENNLYLLAITTYALALSNSDKKHHFKNKLMAKSTMEGGMFNLI